MRASPVDLESGELVLNALFAKELPVEPCRALSGVSVLAIVGGQASPGVGLGVLVTSPPAEKHPKSRFPDVPGGPARRPRDVRDVTC